jgi:hypothetical protein
MRLYANLKGLWLPLWHLQTFLVLLIWLLCCLSFFHLWLLITSLTSSNFSCPFYFGHCVVCPSSIYGFWLPLRHLQTFLVLLIWLLCCLSFFHLWLLITSSASSNFSCSFNLAIVLSVLLPSMAFDYLFGIFKLFLQLMKWKFSIKIITLYAGWEFSFLVVVVVVGFITICIISVYHHQSCVFESRWGRGIQHYVIKSISDLWQVEGFLRVSTNKTDNHDITEVLLKVALIATKQTNK